MRQISGDLSAFRGGADAELVERLVDKAYSECDLNKDGKLSFSQFKMWVRATPEVFQFLESVFPDVLPEVSEAPPPGGGGGGGGDGSGGGGDDGLLRVASSGSRLAAVASPPQPPGGGGGVGRSRRGSWDSNCSAEDSEEGSGSAAAAAREPSFSSPRRARGPSPTDPSAGELPADKRGVLYKKGRRFHQAVGRTFRLLGNCLYYYHHERDLKPAGELPCRCPAARADRPQHWRSLTAPAPGRRSS